MIIQQKPRIKAKDNCTIRHQDIIKFMSKGKRKE